MGYTPLDIESLDGSFNIIQSIVGVDFGGDKFVIGAVGSFSTATGDFEFDVGPLGVFKSDFSSYSVGVGPYGALVLNENFFLSGQTVLSTSVTEFSFSGGGVSQTQEANSSGLSAEVAANIQKSWARRILRGKIGYNYFTTMPEEGETFSADSITGTVEIEDMFTPTIGGFANAQTSYALDTEGGDVDVPIYVGLGAFMRPNDKAQFGVAYQTQFGQEGLKSSTFLLQGKVRF